ncbi:ATP-binding protein [Kitasatospora cineracea]|uniref:Anti-sigma regulatory factor (Ser/Thr protein kinase) n=1 Tax=Kitasatospora cineracea TaxID=88074 RepID=A0A8G1ULU9_9ACTN|nr:ATP-binding protein [Kitasatospora cineracea]ROR46403.1 anti-sigma regulatory factor (Ser/Thr protein kinase) [Kitasatospora cineracea]
MQPTLTTPPQSPTPRGAARRTACCVMAATDAAVPALRAFARATAARWGLECDDYGLALVVSELVGNAVRHSGSPDVRLLLTADAFALTVTVGDSGRWQSARRRADGLACGGRGLQLVRAYTVRFSVRPTFDGTRVSAALPLLRTGADTTPAPWPAAPSCPQTATASPVVAAPGTQAPARPPLPESAALPALPRAA